MPRPAYNILFIHHSGQLDGSFFSLFYILKNFDRQQVNTLVVLSRSGPAEKYLAEAKIEKFIIPQGILTYNTSEKISLTNVLGWLKMLPGFNPWYHFKLWRLMRKKRIDLVHLNSSSLIFTALIIKLFRKPLVWHIREIIPPGGFGKKIIRLIQRAADRIICIAEDEAVPFLDSPKTSIIYNSVDFKKFNKWLIKCSSKIKEKMGLCNQSTPSVGFIGRIHQTSGIFDLAQAAKQVVQQLPQTKFIIVGAKPKIKKFKLIFKKLLFIPKGQAEYFREMKKMIQKNNLENNFIFLGFCPNIPEIISCLDIIVSPTHLNKFSRLELEAAAMAKPVIVSHLNKNSQILIDGVTGILTPPCRPEKLAQAIIDLLKNKDNRQMMGSAAEAKAYQLFDPQKNAAKIFKIYAEILADS